MLVGGQIVGLFALDQLIVRLQGYCVHAAILAPLFPFLVTFQKLFVAAKHCCRGAFRPDAGGLDWDFLVDLSNRLGKVLADLCFVL